MNVWRKNDSAPESCTPHLRVGTDVTFRIEGESETDAIEEHTENGSLLSKPSFVSTDLQPLAREDGRYRGTHHVEMERLRRLPAGYNVRWWSTQLRREGPTTRMAVQ